MKTDWNIAAKSLDNALGVIKAVCHETPQAALILGSGLNVLMDLQAPKALPYEEIFGIAPTVAGHAGALTIGRVGSGSGAPLVAVFRGRYHMYEGHDWSVVTLPTRIIMEWGIPKLYLTNAAGGLRENFSPGDLMVVNSYRDLISPHWAETGLLPALMDDTPDFCRNELTDEVMRVGEEIHRKDPDFRHMQSGCYAAVTGPSYETLAEVDMLRRLACDAVATSLVPELKAAKAGGMMQVAAISVISNVWNNQPMKGHTEVLDNAHAASGSLDKLFRALLDK